MNTFIYLCSQYLVPLEHISGYSEYDGHINYNGREHFRHTDILEELYIMNWILLAM